jgi:hypothetical protein
VVLKQEQDSIDAEDALRISTLQDDIDATTVQVNIVENKLLRVEKSLGVTSRQRLAKLKGNGFLRLRMNARALKAHIRARVIYHKFEREKLERVYRHQIMREFISSVARAL